jgi:deoxyadenosine/deoxycytidine kinase
MSDVKADDVVHIITIEGGIGAGKSSAMRFLQETRKGIHFIDEPVQQWEDSGLLEAMYSNTIDAGCFQIAALSTRMAPLLKAVREGQRLIVTERCPWSDIEVFTKANLDEQSFEFVAYKMAFDALMTAMPPFKLHVIYLHAEVDLLMARISVRGRAAERMRDDEEKASMRAYLEKLQLRHDLFYGTKLATTRTLIDTNVELNVVEHRVLDAVNAIAPVKLEAV